MENSLLYSSFQICQKMLFSITLGNGYHIPRMFSRNIATLIKGTELANKIKLEVRNELINIRQTKPEFEPQFVAIAIGKFDYFFFLNKDDNIHNRQPDERTYF